MQRLALVVVTLALLAGCRELNPESCENPDNIGVPPCGMPPDGPPIDTSCKDDNGCSATPDQPVCRIADNVGVCVECTVEKAAKCTDRRLICANDRCALCTRHSDCTASEVCRSDGTCALETEVAYVNGATGTDQMMCTKASPCTKIENAAMTGRIVKVTGTVTERTTLNNRNALILGDPGATLAPSMDAIALEVRGTSQVQIFDLAISHPTPAPTREGVTVADTADLKLTRVTISNNNADGARVSGGKLTCTRCTIAQNTGRGINLADGKLTISQSTIQKNLGGGIAIGQDADEFQIVGNVIFNNGVPTTATPGSGTGGINAPQVMGSTANRVDFNSISRNDAATGVAPGINCVSINVSLIARFNILWDNGTPPAFREQINSGGAGCDHMFSDIGPLPLAVGTNNVRVEPDFMNENGGDLHLMQSKAGLIVNPSPGELSGLAARDIDDQPRAAPTDMGADHVPRAP